MFGKVDLPNGISLRPAEAKDAAVERQVIEASNEALWLADASRDYIQSVVELQHRAQHLDHSAKYPNALTFIVEKTGVACGRLVLDFDAGYVHVVALALIPEARHKGIGATVLEAVQTVAGRMQTPVLIAVRQHHTDERAIATRLGFTPAGPPPRPDMQYLIWRPAAPDGAG